MTPVSASSVLVEPRLRLVGETRVGDPEEATTLSEREPTWRAWLKLIRVHQYAKNLLVFIPLLAGHAFELNAIIEVGIAFLAFSLCASAGYVLNDLIDLDDDRRHRTKSNRPLASGAIPLRQARLAVPLLLSGSLLVAAAVSLPFLGTLAGYFALTAAYSLVIKRKTIADVVALAFLYTLRVIGGAVAAEVVVSHWLLAFSLCFFMSLALMKRFVELAGRADAAASRSTSRGYQTGDMAMVGALAAAAGFNAVTVLALYITTDTVSQHYSRPEVLWLICPVLMYWVARAMLLAQRRAMHDDPVVFALKDRVSLFSILIVVALVVAAI